MINYFKEIRYILDKEAKKVPLLLLLFLFASIIDLLGIGLIAPYVGLIVDPAGFNESYIYNLAIEMGVPFQYYDPITLIGVILVIIFGAKTILAIFINKAILSFSYKQSVILRSLLMGSYQQLPYTDFIDNNSSKYIYNIQQMAGSFSQGILQSILRLASEAIVAIVLLLFLAITNFSALIMLVIMLGSTMFIFDWLFKAKMERYGRLANEHLTCMIKGIQEGMNGLKEIRILKKEKYFYDAVHDSAKDYAKVSVKNQVIYVAPRYIIEFVLILFVVTLVLVAQLMNQNLTELLPVLSMFGLAAIQLLMVLTRFVLEGIL